MNLPFQRPRHPRAIADGCVERDMDYGEGGPTYRVHYAVTYGGCAPQLSGPPENCYPGEAAEWEITGIDAERWDDEHEFDGWIPIEQVCAKHEIDAIEHWAEMLDLSDECEEALRDEQAAAMEWRAEQRRDPLD